MKVRSLGHVVIKVRNQQRAEGFYNGLLGIPIAARYEPLSMTFFTLGNHHDFAVILSEMMPKIRLQGQQGCFMSRLKSATASTNSARRNANSRLPV